MARPDLTPEAATGPPPRPRLAVFAVWWHLREDRRSKVHACLSDCPFKTLCSIRVPLHLFPNTQAMLSEVTCACCQRKLARAADTHTLVWDPEEKSQEASCKIPFPLLDGSSE